MQRPQEQFSTYKEASGDSTRASGVQEPNHRTVKPTQSKPITATDPVLKLPSAPADPKANGDPTVSAAADHNVKVPASTTPPKQADKSSAPLGNQGATTGTTTGPN